MMQLSWDPTRPLDEILDEICRYYFGTRAAPLVKRMLYLMEEEKGAANRRATSFDPRIPEFAEQVKPMLPDV